MTKNLLNKLRRLICPGYPEKSVKELIKGNFLVALALNILLAYVVMMICRLVYLAENWDLFSLDLTWAAFFDILRGGIRFDTSALFYLNSLYILLVLIPVHVKECRGYYSVIKWAYVVPNAIAVIANLCDAVYYPFSNQRVTMLTFRQFEHENNLTGIFGVELINHWYLVLCAVILIAALIWLYRRPTTVGPVRRPLWRYYVGRSVALIVVGYIAVCGIRGSWLTTASRPIAVSEAHLYTHRPNQAALVLNTPFAIIRTLNSVPVEVPEYFDSKEALDAAYSPVHQVPDSLGEFKRKNVVVLIVESFAEEFIGARNRNLDGGTYRGYTPFADSLMTVSLTFEHTFANTGFSIDAMPAVLAAIPRVNHSFVLTPFSLSRLQSLPGELGKNGYHSAFFHGADNQSLGFSAFAKHIGFKEYYGINEYVADKRFGGMNDFDGHWGIWDEEFLQFFCTKLSEMPQPFFASIFTLSSHHPFKVPKKYEKVFVDEGIHKLHKCIRYTDNALRLFFEEASKQPWYKNTIFVLTADHASSKVTHDEYKTIVGHSRVPIFIFDPSGEMPRGTRPGVMQHVDIMPTILSYLNYHRPYVAFGKDMLHATEDDMWAFDWQNCPVMIDGDYILQSDGFKPTALYNYVEDPLLQTNLVDKPEQAERQARIWTRLRGIIQSYMQRASSDNLVVESD